MSMADTDKDGRVSKEEHARHCQMMFDKMDSFVKERKCNGGK
jgi:hypothetical protein